MTPYEDKSDQTSHGLALRLQTIEYLGRFRESKKAKVAAGSVGLAAIAAWITHRLKRRQK